MSLHLYNYLCGAKLASTAGRNSEFGIRNSELAVRKSFRHFKWVAYLRRAVLVVLSAISYAGRLRHRV
jgi:hypothetical protein